MFSIRTCIIVIVISAEETAIHSSTRSSSSLQRRTVILHSRRSSPVILQKQFLLHRENDSYDSHSVRTRESFHPCEFLSSKRSLFSNRSYLSYVSSHRFKRRKITTCPTEKHKTQVHNGQGSSFGSDRNLSPPPRKNKRDASIGLLSLTPRIERSNCTRETVSTLSRITRRSNQSVDPVHRRGHRIERVWSERNVNTDGWINEDSVARYQARPSR